MFRNQDIFIPERRKPRRNRFAQLLFRLNKALDVRLMQHALKKKAFNRTSASRKARISLKLYLLWYELYCRYIISIKDVFLK